jgi:hypothetical protein
MTYDSEGPYMVIPKLYEKYGLGSFWHKKVKEDLGDVIAAGLRRAKVNGYLLRDGLVSTAGNGVYKYRLSAKALTLLKVDTNVCRGTN